MCGIVCATDIILLLQDQHEEGVRIYVHIQPIIQTYATEKRVLCLIISIAARHEQGPSNTEGVLVRSEKWETERVGVVTASSPGACMHEVAINPRLHLNEYSYTNLL